MTVPSAGASLAEWLAYQERVHPRSIELGLDRVGRVAARLGLPAHIPTLTVAGTNGKGSSATLAALIYREAGYRVGLYTSPHLLRYNERVVIDGFEISDVELCAAFEAVERERGETALTYFEYGTLAALWLFRARGVHVQVLEVGLGGRLDAVNLVDADAALITSIGIDHTDWLGPDRESIAVEKAQVFRSDRPAICADPDPPAAIAEQAQAIGAKLLQLDREFAFDVTQEGWNWRGPSDTLDQLPMPGIGGIAQLRNAAGVIAAVQSLQSMLPVSGQAIRAALPRLALRGRFERAGRVIYDVAHNAEAARVLAERLVEELGSIPLRLVLGMLADKPVEAFCRVLAPHVQRAYCATLPGPRGLDARTLGERARAAGLDAVACTDVAGAIESARADMRAEDWMLVTGSFLTVAEALRHG